MKKVIYTEKQIYQLKVLLNSITTTGIQNAKQIAVIDQVLESGTVEEMEEEGAKASDNK